MVIAASQKENLFITLVVLGALLQEEEDGEAELVGEEEEATNLIKISNLPLKS